MKQECMCEGTLQQDASVFWFDALQRCMRVHEQVLSQAALTEFKTGDPERGRGVFEGILRNYPKRLDLWSIYLDQVLIPSHAAYGDPFLLL